MSASATRPLSVYPQLPEPGAPTLGSAARLYLEHLALRVETDNFSRDNFLNIQRDVGRFVEAWSVLLPDRRHFLVPLLRGATVTDKRRLPRPHPYAARTSAEAITKAFVIAEAMKAGPGLPPAGGEALVRQNGDRPLAECGGDDFTRWLLANPQWESGHSKTNPLKAICDCLRWYEEDFGVRSPYRRKHIPKFVKLSRRQAEDREYIALMRHGSSRQLRRALWCLYNVGLRTCEMREMHWRDFNWEAGFVLTYRHKTARLSNRARLVVLTARQRRFFAALYRQRAGDGLVFVNTDGGAWTRRSFATHLRRAAAKLGLDEGIVDKVSGYCFRHTFGTQADEAGIADEEAGMVMGHSGPTMQRTVYSKASKKVRHVRKVTEEIERKRRKSRLEQRVRPTKPALETQGQLF
jgi:integrase